LYSITTVTSSGNSIEKWKSVGDFAAAGISTHPENPDASFSGICYAVPGNCFNDVDGRPGKPVTTAGFVEPAVSALTACPVFLCALVFML
jgi:hypothetical protein